MGDRKMSKRFELAEKYTQKYKAQLSPCPVCGNTDIRIVSDRGIFPSRNLWGVVCTRKNCECTGAYPKVKEAVAHWKKLAVEEKDD